MSRVALLRLKGADWFEKQFMPTFHPVMLSVCSFCNHTRHWFPAPPAHSV